MPVRREQGILQEGAENAEARAEPGSRESGASILLA
jgi:hypothetical protein